MLGGGTAADHDQYRIPPNKPALAVAVLGVALLKGHTVVNNTDFLPAAPELLGEDLSQRWEQRICSDQHEL